MIDPSAFAVTNLECGKTELNYEIWGKGVCDIWEKWVSGWRNKIR